METYQDIAFKLYSVALKYATESKGMIGGGELKTIPDRSRSRLENIAATAGILAADVICNKPQIEMQGSRTVVPISRKEPDISNDINVKIGLFKNYIASIQSRTRYRFRFAR